MKGHMPMVVVGIMLIICALIISIVPQVTSCQSQGQQITLQNGKTIPMKCYWTGQAELVDGILLLIVGILLIVSKRKETMMFLSIIGIALGIVAILLPTVLIGVCATLMICNTVMKMALLILGPLVIIDSVVGLIVALKMQENG
jgi:uncharacterized membrane protein HdeD (DUF308 family)